MMEVEALYGQSLIDLAIQTSGSVEAAFGLATRNDVSISDSVPAGARLERAAVADRLVLSRYEARRVKPATDVTPEQQERVPYGGVDYMGVEIDFIVS